MLIICTKIVDINQYLLKLFENITGVRFFKPQVVQRGGLRHYSSAALFILRTRRSTTGDRAFAVAAPRVWNELPPAVTTASSVLKTKLTVSPIIGLHDSLIVST